MGTIVNDGHRLNLKLSNHALNVLEGDAFVFLNKKNISGMINRIIINSMDTSEASISFWIDRYQTELDQILGSGKDKAVSEIKKKLLNHYIDGLVNRMTDFPKDKAINFRLSNAAVDLIYSNDGVRTDAIYYGSEVVYIKALVEDYCRKTEFQREWIFYRDYIERIELDIDAAERASLLGLQYFTMDGSSEKFYVKPYRLTSENETSSVYLIALSKFAGNDNEEYRPALFKIDRIKSMQIVRNSVGQGKISSEEEHSFEDMIAKRGVYFLWNKEDEIEIRLTAEGYRMYRNVKHMRPVPATCEKSDGGAVLMRFHCTQKQIEYYFLKFCGDVEIISPESLRNVFLDHYERAAKCYNLLE